MEKLIKTYGTYFKPIIYKKYNDKMEVVVEVYEIGEDKAKLIARKWNGRTWNHVAFAFGTKAEANQLIHKINTTNEITNKEFTA